ncbi:putative hmg-i hmg-y dna-binding conserved site [Phaeomoniella chlamydospora]|uniref:Putative hmg-i hmg-y dna-binding conserved site n=1 Tax=Phaeomoniella chlamydospora TaxID=158046 RepID=A0A0G2EXB0_PHACM|nr:putative hmg-i hmg-y dna-binding conserved site [Phaeomoniella chlamydospora]
MAGENIEKGDKVSWNWGSGHPGGEVAEKKTQGEVSIKSHRGNTIKKIAEPDNPAVHIARSGNDVVKKASELHVDKKGGGKGKSASPAPPPSKKENGENTKKRPHQDSKDKDQPAEKKSRGRPRKPEQPTNGTSASEQKEKKPRGRPKKGEGVTKAKKEKKPSKPRDTKGVSARTRSRA